MPSKKRLLRKMVQPWFLQQQQQQQRQQSSEEMAEADTINFDLFIKEFEQEFIDWLLVALRESDSMELLQEILKGKSICSGSLRQLFRVARDYGGLPEPGDDLETGANEQESGNETISWSNKNQVIADDGSQGEQAGGHQSLDLEQIVIEGEKKKRNNENLDKGAVQDNNENGCGSSNELSPVGESLKWFVQDGKGTIRRRPSGGSKRVSGKCEGKTEWPPHHHHSYNLEQLLSQFKRHQESSEQDDKESIYQSNESGIESLTQDDDTTDDSDDDDDDNELDKTLVPQNYNDP